MLEDYVEERISDAAYHVSLEVVLERDEAYRVSLEDDDLDLRAKSIRRDAAKKLGSAVATRWLLIMLAVVVLSWFVELPSWTTSTIVPFVAGGIVHYAISKADLPSQEEIRRRLARRASSTEHTGGFTARQAAGCLLMSDPMPAGVREEEAFAAGAGRLTGFMIGDPPSPALQWRATDSGLYFINPDQSLYMGISWGAVRSVRTDEGGVVGGGCIYHWSHLIHFRLSATSGAAGDALRVEIETRARRLMCERLLMLLRSRVQQGVTDTDA